MVLREGSPIAPPDSIGANVETRATIDAMGPCFGPAWRRGGWPLLHTDRCSSVVTDATGDSMVSIRGNGLHVGSGHGATSWGGVGPKRYVLYMFVLILVDSIYQTCIWMLTLYSCCFVDVGPRG
jgi:hypothetical protein